MRNIVIVGSGGLAREVRWLIEDCNKRERQWNILGWISKEEQGAVIAGLPVLGDDDWLLGYKESLDVAVSIGDGKLRKKIVSYLKQNDSLSFPVIISPSAELADSVDLKEGAIIAAKCVLTADITIGAFYVCNPGCTVGHDCRFDSFVTLSPGVHISGNVKLGEGVTIGVGASVIQGIMVGDHTMVGAGAVVINDLPSNCTAVGVPAKPLEK